MSNETRRRRSNRSCSTADRSSELRKLGDIIARMSRKRRAPAPDSDNSDSGSEDSISSSSNSDSDDSGSEESENYVECDFQFFDPQKQDFLGIKHLLRQLFDADADEFDLDGLTELVLAQPLVGTTVKTEDHQGDPWSVLTVLNLRVHRDNAVIQSLVKYFLEKANKSQTMKDVLSSQEAEVGLILSERIINIPHDVAPPSYDMLEEEIRWANEENEPYQFTHYLIVSRTYSESATDRDMDDDEVAVKPRAKKQKRQSAVVNQYFHPEDELFSRKAETVSYSFGNKDSGDDQSLKTSGLLMLIGKKDFESSILDMDNFFKGE